MRADVLFTGEQGRFRTNLIAGSVAIFTKL